MSEELKSYIIAADDADGVGSVELSSEEYTSSNTSINTSNVSTKASIVNRFKAFLEVLSLNLSNVVTNEGDICGT